MRGQNEISNSSESGRATLVGLAVKCVGMGLTGPGQGMARFLTSKSLKSFVNKDLVLAIENPVVFTVTRHTIRPTHGYEAWMLPALCNAVIDADNENSLPPLHHHVD